MLNVVIQTLGGLGLFILGMKMMTEGLQMTAGDRIKKILGWKPRISPEEGINYLMKWAETNTEFFG